MFRTASDELDIWLKNQSRKPLVLRGARQTGKTWIVRELAMRHQFELVELNFEQHPNLSDLFNSNNPQLIIENIEAEIGQKIDPEHSLLFLDEIQAVPELLSKLRWFKENMPKLAVVAAGSLLEFALQKMQYSMPVGRITYFYLEQLSFLEFILAAGHTPLYQKLLSYNINHAFPKSLHEKCLGLYYEYCLVGGMPEIVQDWIVNRKLNSCIKLQHDLISTYRDDFYKYGSNIDPILLHKIFESICDQLGNKFIFSRVSSAQKTTQIKPAIIMLSQARVCTPVFHTSGNGLPLGSQSNEKFFKMLMNDIGLISAQSGLTMINQRINHKKVRDFIFSNRGGMAEQFIGQQLRAIQSPYLPGQLFYWQRTGGRAGEIDYIIQHENRIIPIEVKAGSSGSMKSLHQFMSDKGLDFALRCDTNPVSVTNLNLKTTQGDQVSYQLLSIPVYLIEMAHKLIDQASE